MSVDGVVVSGPSGERFDEILTDDALAFVAALQREFGQRREELLRSRGERQERIDAGERPDFPAATAAVRDADWRVPPPPPGLVSRRVEITGPTDRKMMINALNSGAQVFMADFEDANSPTWANLVGGQVNVADAVRRRISLETPERQYVLAEETATLVVRPRGWHLEEPRLPVDGRPTAASLFDFGLAAFHNAREQIDRGVGPYFYLPKLESHEEAALWHDVFSFTEEALALPRGTVRATVLIETILAAFEMDEILQALGEHAVALNAGRWDYIFSVIKKFREDPAFVLPDRSQVTMTVPFMRAYTNLLVQTCHRRGAYAIGGMAAYIPSRRDPEANERALEQVRADKDRESNDGFDGTWVAHPDLVPTAMAEFDRVLGDRDAQLDRLLEDVRVGAADLLDTRIQGGTVTERGLRTSVSVGIRYLGSWLTGVGAAAIDNLMEDAATAEISRSQCWQWIRHGAETGDGRPVTLARVRDIARAEGEALRANLGAEAYLAGRLGEAGELFDALSAAARFVEFLTIPAMALLEPALSGPGS
ncbi:MAG: malate synthase A [Actinomycetota bacterium]